MPPSDVPEFVPFPKIPRLNRAVIVTEKIDGTNASIHVLEDGRVLTASRNRWITPEDDNAGFSRWVHDRADELRDGLGVGSHFGEWWGSGIQRRYGLAEKRFSLFNATRWAGADGLPDRRLPFGACVVPVVGTLASLTDGQGLTSILNELRANGSAAAPGFMRPEGVVVFHVASGNIYKVTLEQDSEPKGVVRAAE